MQLKLGRKTLLLFSFFGLQPSSVLPPECDVISAGAPVSESRPAIERWSFRDATIKLRADQVLPPKYLSELKAAFGEVNAKIERVEERIEVNITAGDKNVGKFILQRPGDRYALEMHTLRLENPLAEYQAGGVAMSQYQKGLPPEIFRFAREQIFAFARAGNYKRIITDSAENFTVLTLYRRTVGMEPAGQRAKQVIGMLDELYAFARKEMPESVRPKNIQEFTEILGSSSKREDLDLDCEFVLDAYSRKQQLPNGARVLTNDKGKLMAVVVNEGAANQRVKFVNTSMSPPTIFQWFDVAYRRDMPLMREL